MVNAYNSKLLQEAYEIREKTFWKVFLENIERELRRKRYDLENVHPDRLGYLQGYIQGLRFVVGDARGELKSIADKIIENLKKDSEAQ